jgi:hypothetical protein
MGTLDSEDRDRLRDSDFAWVDEDGDGHLPIHDEAHARNAVARFSQTDFESPVAKRQAARNVLRAAERHGIDVGDDTAVRKAADD